MARFVFERAIGTINGVNRDFKTSAPFRPGSISVFRNGQLQSKDLSDSGWAETGQNTFRLNTAPVSEGVYPDIIQVSYVPV